MDLGRIKAALLYYRLAEKNAGLLIYRHENDILHVRLVSWQCLDAYAELSISEKDLLAVEKIIKGSMLVDTFPLPDARNSGTVPFSPLDPSMMKLFLLKRCPSPYLQAFQMQ